jgi:hypothetical protein
VQDFFACGDQLGLMSMRKHSLNGIIKTVDTIQDQISFNKIRSARHNSQIFRDLHHRTLEQIRGIVEGIEQSLSTRNLTAADLAIRSRRGYQWLKFLADPENHLSHMLALKRMTIHLEKVRRKSRAEVLIRLYHQGSLYKVRHQGRQVEMVAQESFLTAPDEILEALVEIALVPSNKEARTLLQDYSFTKEYQKVRETLEYLGIPEDSYAAGKAHHLKDSFTRVNQTYFEGMLAKPHLVWNQRLTHRKFGHFQWDTDTVMVSSTLDDLRVPEMVVDYVIFHELLHKKIGTKRTNQNRIAHTREFRKEEEQFHQLKKARQFLNKLSTKRARFR